jgi:hypothetical protein
MGLSQCQLPFKKLSEPTLMNFNVVTTPYQGVASVRPLVNTGLDLSWEPDSIYESLMQPLMNPVISRPLYSGPVNRPQVEVAAHRPQVKAVAQQPGVICGAALSPEMSPTMHRTVVHCAKKN